MEHFFIFLFLKKLLERRKIIVKDEMKDRNKAGIYESQENRSLIKLSTIFRGGTLKTI